MPRSSPPPLPTPLADADEGVFLAEPVDAPIRVPPPRLQPQDADPPRKPPQWIFEAESIEERVAIVTERSLPFWLWDMFSSACEWLFGIFSLIVILALFSTMSVLQLLSIGYFPELAAWIVLPALLITTLVQQMLCLGYFLEVAGRVARSGRFRDAFVGVRKGARIGGVVLGTWICMWPVWLVSGFWYDAQLIAPGSGVAAGWRVAQIVVSVLMIGHIVASWYAGGKLRHFFWPLIAPFSLALWTLRLIIASKLLRPVTRPILAAFSDRLLADVYRVPPLTDWFVPAIVLAGLVRGRAYANARDSLWEFAAGLRLPYYFWLGLRGFVGAVLWLFFPILLLAAGTQIPNAAGAVLALLGALLLTFVVLYLPFMQVLFAAEGKFSAFINIGQVRRLFRRAPLLWWLALLLTLASAVPLYLLKVELTPTEAAWLPGLFFVLFIWPARVLTGWAVGRSFHRQPPSGLRLIWAFFARWTARLAALPIVLIYVLIVHVTRYTSWNGAWSMFEQHAFLVPVPFLGM